MYGLSVLVCITATVFFFHFNFIFWFLLLCVSALVVSVCFHVHATYTLFVMLIYRRIISHTLFSVRYVFDWLNVCKFTKNKKTNPYGTWTMSAVVAVYQNANVAVALFVEMNAFGLLFRSSHLERGAMCSAGRINIGGAKTQHFFSYRITSSAHCAGILDNILLQ